MSYTPPWKRRYMEEKAMVRDIVGPLLAPEVRAIVKRDHPKAFEMTTVDLAARYEVSTLLKREQFVREYLKDFNVKNAARRCGYVTDQYSYQIFNEPYVQRRILELLRDIEEDDLVTRKDIVLGLLREARTASSDSARVAAWSKLAKIKGMEIELIKGEFEHRHSVMEVPQVVDAVSWEEAASVSQENLKVDVRK